MKLILRVASAILAAVIIPTTVLAQQFDWHKYGAVYGAGAVAFEADGGFWVAQGNVAHFDGKVWSYYDQLNTYGGLMNNTARAVLVDKAGHLWVGLEGSVSRFDGKQWTRYTHESTGGGLAPGKVTTILQDSQGYMWFSLNSLGNEHGGISRFDGQTWTQWGATGRPLPSCSGLEVRGIAFDTNGLLWGAMTNCAASFDGTRWREYRSEETSGALQGAFSITADRQGGIWFGGVGVLTRHFNGRWTNTTPYSGGSANSAGIFRSGAPGHFSAGMAVDSTGALWATATPTDHPHTQPGLFQYDGNNWRRIRSGAGSESTQPLTLDPRGHLWFHTPEGLSSYDGKNFQRRFNIANTESGPPRYINALAVDIEGKVWAGGSGIALFDGRNWQRFDPAQTGIPAAMSVNAIVSRGGSTWFALENNYSTPRIVALARHSSRGWRVFHPADMGVRLSWFSDIAIDSKGALWAATDAGLLSYDGTNWRLRTSQNTNGGLPSNAVKGVTIDARDQVWVGSGTVSPLAGGLEGGVSSFDGNTWNTWTVASTNGTLATNNIGKLRFDSKGNLLAIVGASLTLRNVGGLGVFDGTRWRMLTEASYASLGNSIQNLTTDNEGRFWLSTDKGVVAHDNETTWETLTRANLRNVLPEDDVRDIAVDRAGNVWFAFKEGGLVVLKAAGTTSASTARPVPLRVGPKEPQFAPTPEFAALKEQAAMNAARAKADAEAAKIARSSATREETQEYLCRRYEQVIRSHRSSQEFNQMVSFLDDTRIPLDILFMAPVCKLSDFDGGARAPVLHHLAELDYGGPYLDDVWRLFVEKRKDEASWLKIVNARNTKGESLLDYAESLAQEYPDIRSNVDQFSKRACSRGARYVKVAKSCPQ